MMPFAFLQNIGTTELLIVAFVSLLVFGNRTIQQAQHAFDGYAYRLAGVEPGNLCGVAIPDPADLETR